MKEFQASTLYVDDICPWPVRLSHTWIANVNGCPLSQHAALHEVAISVPKGPPNEKAEGQGVSLEMLIHDRIDSTANSCALQIYGLSEIQYPDRLCDLGCSRNVENAMPINRDTRAQRASFLRKGHYHSACSTRFMPSRRISIPLCAGQIRKSRYASMPKQPQQWD